jgi:hypothetical protein
VGWEGRVDDKDIWLWRLRTIRNDHHLSPSPRVSLLLLRSYIRGCDPVPQISADVPII